MHELIQQAINIPFVLPIALLLSLLGFMYLLALPFALATTAKRADELAESMLQEAKAAKDPFEGFEEQPPAESEFPEYAASEVLQ